MRILIFNLGSSSIKCQYFISELSVASILIEDIKNDNSSICTLWYANEKVVNNIYIGSYKNAINETISMLMHSGVLPSIASIDGIGHRVVHGGVEFSKPTIITKRVIDMIESLIPLAPLHNRANLDGIKIIHKHYPHIPQVAIFDTAFHHTIPYYAYLYALPYEMYENLNIRRYGFHGTSHSYILKESVTFLDKRIEDINIISLHLGSGASVCAIKGGKSIDISMGMTPLEGLIMGTRCGDIDPSIGYYISKKRDLSIAEIDSIYNNQSGLEGICGKSDMREIIYEAIEKGDRLCNIALDMFVYRVKKYIGSYAVALGRVDAIVFTGGVGENSNIIREMICEGLGGILGLYIDRDKNIKQKVGSISDNISKIDILVIPTNEELEMAREVGNTL
jgi:acetate kinase